MAFRPLRALLVFMVALSLTGCGDDSTTSPPSRPNIVLIVADDLGYGDLGSYGQQQIQTPHLDRMAREGLRFTQFYAGSTVCAPSRSVIMTGQHTGHTPIRGNNEVLPIGQQPLPDSAVTVAEMLRAAGYRTGMFGKWGLGGPGSGGMPHRQGFDRFFGYIGQRRAHFYWPEFLFESNADSLWRVPLEGNVVEDDPERHPGSGPPVERGTYSHDAILDRAMAFIEESAGQQPFFAYLPVTIPHASVVAPEEAFAPYLDDEGNSIFDETPHVAGHYTSQPMPKAAYAAMVTHLDQGVGRIMDRLEALGIADNTLVLFTSDNGPHSEGGYEPAYFDSNGPLRGMKRDLYEGGIRVPHLAWWPGRIEAGTTTDAIGYFGDYMATFADMAETDAPTGAIDSQSLMPVLRGEADTLRADAPLYWEFYARGSKQAVRLGKWKAVRAPMMTGPIELYDLEADPGESNNVATAHPDIVNRIAAIMAEAHTPSPGWSVPSTGE